MWPTMSFRMRTVCFVAIVAGTLAGSLGRVQAAAITNLSLVNVTPTSFSVLWRMGNSTPTVQVFADPNGVTNLTARFPQEVLPVHTGNPAAANAYERRRSRALIQEKARDLGFNLVRLTGLKAGTTYYYRAVSTFASTTATYPESGPLPAITTPAENTFVLDDQQLIVEVPGLDTMGQVVTLTHTNAAHPIAAFVGDGVGTNQVFFNVNDLFALAGGGGNLAPLGLQYFTTKVYGPGQSETVAQFTLTFTTNFSVGAATQQSLGTEFLAISLGSTVMLMGQTSSVPVTLNSSVGVNDLSVVLGLKAGYLTNFALVSPAAEVDPASVSFTVQTDGVTTMRLKTRAGMFLQGARSVGDLRFFAPTGQLSAFVPLKIQQITGKKGDASAIANLIAQSGRAVIIGQQSLLEAGQPQGAIRPITLYARPVSAYALEYSGSVGTTANWKRMTPVVVNSLVTPMVGPSGEFSNIFYRAVEVYSDPPVLAASLNPDKTRTITVFGKPGGTYEVQYRTNVSNVTTWAPLANVVLTNSFGSFPVGNTNSVIFYRLKKTN